MPVTHARFLASLMDTDTLNADLQETAFQIAADKVKDSWARSRDNDHRC